MEAIKARTLLKANDGSEFVEFRYYTFGRRKCDFPTATFIGKTPQGKKVYRQVKDYRLADKAEADLLDALNKRRRDAAWRYSWYSDLYYKMLDRDYAFCEQMKYLSYLPTEITKLHKYIEEQKKKTIDAVVKSKTKESIGEVIKKEFDDIKFEVRLLLPLFDLPDPDDCEAQIINAKNELLQSFISSTK